MLIPTTWQSRNELGCKMLQYIRNALQTGFKWFELWESSDQHSTFFLEGTCLSAPTWQAWSHLNLRSAEPGVFYQDSIAEDLGLLGVDRSICAKSNTSSWILKIRNHIYILYTYYISKLRCLVQSFWVFLHPPSGWSVPMAGDFPRFRGRAISANSRFYEPSVGDIVASRRISTPVASSAGSTVRTSEVDSVLQIWLYDC